MKLKKGDLYYFDVAYEDDPSTVKKRPIMILEEDNDDFLLLISTTSQPRNNPLKYYDQYKIPIYNWRKTGLSKPSWFRAYQLIRISRDKVESVVSSTDYIGRMHAEDFNNIVKQLERLHN